MGTLYYYVLVIKTGITSQSLCPRSSVFPRFAGGKRSELRSPLFLRGELRTRQNMVSFMMRNCIPIKYYYIILSQINPYGSSRTFLGSILGMI